MLKSPDLTLTINKLRKMVCQSKKGNVTLTKAKFLDLLTIGKSKGKDTRTAFAAIIRNEKDNFDKWRVYENRYKYR